MTQQHNEKLMLRKSFTLEPPEITKPPTFPWYKERLLTKCLIDAKNKRHLSGALDSRRWRFLDADLNDFRDGYPTHTSKHILTQGQRATRPKSNPTFPLDEEHMKRFSKEQACFSKQTLRQQARTQHVTAVEQKLIQHPLALYPHLEQGMPPELFDQVISVLDPDMCVNRPSTVTPPDNGHLKEEEEEHVDDSTELCETQMQEAGKEVKEGPLVNETSGPKNPYRVLLAGESVAKEDQSVSVKRLPSPSQDKDIKTVTKLFCDWVVSLGGESDNLTESTLQGLFVSSLSVDKKPSPTFPINVVEPKNYPEELRDSEELRNDHAYDARLKDSVPQHKRPLGTKRPIYGAWYLNPKTWRKRDVNEPEDLSDYEFSEMQSERDEALKQMHGTQAFRQFIITKGLRVPRFLSALFAEEEGVNAVGSTSTRKSASTRKGKVGL